MSRKAGEILVRLWDQVDQAGYDMEIKEAFRLAPTDFQKRMIQTFLESDKWDNGDLTEDEKEEY